MTTVTEETEGHAPDLDGIALTEFEAIEVHQVKGVRKGANGFPHLLLKGLDDGAEPASAPPAEPAETGRPSWHAAAAALARLGARAPDIDPGELFKAVNAAGEIDEAPDIAGGRQAIALIGKLIEYEAQELQAGCLDEVCDISLLCQAADCLRTWLGMEQAPDDGAMKGCGCCGQCTAPGDGCCEMCGDAAKAVDDLQRWDYPPSVETFTEKELVEMSSGDLVLAKDSRTFTAAERKKHAADGNALPDGSYPIPDKDALRRAAILARSGHGDVKAAKRLIARRARELGVPNPLDTDDKATKATAGAVVAEEETAVDTEAIDQAVAKALAPYQERVDALGDQLAKAQADLEKALNQPIHGGPVLSAAAARAASKPGEDHAAKAAYYDDQAAKAADPSDANAYRQLAAQQRAKIPAS